MEKKKRYAAHFARQGRKVLVLAALLISILGTNTNVKAAELDVSYFAEVTEWEKFLEDNHQMKMVYSTFVGAVDENGERIYKDEFLIGVMANILHEGEPGVVEHAFSKCGQYGFLLPSGGSFVETIDDILYLAEWGTSNEGSKEKWASKGSLGVSSLQWSYDRRVEWLSILQNILEEEARSFVTENDIFLADAAMLLYELNPAYAEDHDEDFYGVVTRLAEKKGGSAEEYAEALCDFYVRPGHACWYSEDGSACITRREEAKRLWKIFSSQNTCTIEIKISSIANKQTNTEEKDEEDWYVWNFVKGLWRNESLKVN